jgi:hypothetical protein
MFESDDEMADCFLFLRETGNRTRLDVELIGKELGDLFLAGNLAFTEQGRHSFL